MGGRFGKPQHSPALLPDVSRRMDPVRCQRPCLVIVTFVYMQERHRLIASISTLCNFRFGAHAAYCRDQLHFFALIMSPVWLCESVMIPVRAAQDGTKVDSWHPHHASSRPIFPNPLAHELWEDSPSRLLERAVLPDHRLPLHHLTHARRHRNIDPHASSLCLKAVPFCKGRHTSRAFSVGVRLHASMMDTACCATVDIRVFSLSVDTSLYPVTLAWAIPGIRPCHNP